MFCLHDTTRRRIGLAAFVLAGLLPALWIAAWCVERRLPGNAAAEADRLSRQLGLLVRLDEVEYPRPGAMRYEKIVLADPETAQPILRCRSLEVAWRESGDEADSKSRRPLLIVTALQPQMDAASMDRAWRWLQGFLENRLGRLPADVRLTAAEWTLCDADRRHALVGVEGTVETQAAGTDIQITFRPAGAEASEPVRLRIVRNRQASPPASGFELYTGGSELPCDVLGMGLADLKPLGARCRFRAFVVTLECR